MSMEFFLQIRIISNSIFLVGKTFTIQGESGTARGMIPRMLDQLFVMIERETQIVCTSQLAQQKKD